MLLQARYFLYVSWGYWGDIVLSCIYMVPDAASHCTILPAFSPIREYRTGLSPEISSEFLFVVHDVVAATSIFLPRLHKVWDSPKLPRSDRLIKMSSTGSMESVRGFCI
jgi:hypothetical protein